MNPTFKLRPYIIVDSTEDGYTPSQITLFLSRHS